MLASATLPPARGALGAVFASLDPFDEPFTPVAKDRLILYPAEGYELSVGAWSGLTTAARSIGEATAYFATVEGQRAGTLDTVWEVGLSSETTSWFSSSATDGTRNPVAESAIWSPAGTWGLLISHEQHVVVGGTEDFVRRLAVHFPDVYEQAASFVRDVTHFAGGIDRRPSWLARLLAHVYGEETATELLAAGTGRPELGEVDDGAG